MPHGVLFRGNAEARIREKLIHQGYIKGIIGLPANLFYGIGIPACIIVMNKEQASARKGIFMIDASKGFIKDGNKNRLRSQDIHKVVDVFTKQLELPRFSRMVSFSEIAANDYNLNIPRYIDSSEPEDLHDLSAHLSGGIPNCDIDALDSYWQVFPSIRASLFKPAREGYSDSLIEASQVKASILNHPEFKIFAATTLAIFTQWKQSTQLKDIAQGDKPKVLIERISESLLNDYVSADLLNQYDIYQILMDYWEELMQDDVYVLTQDGWAAGQQLRELVAKKGEKLKETPDLIINKAKYKAELIPPALIVSRYFQAEQTALEQLQAELDAVTQTLESFIDEHNGEEGLLVDAQTDAGKITKASVAARLKLAIDVDEIGVLNQCKQWIEAEAKAKKAVKDTQETLDKQVFAKYPNLTEEEIKTLVVDDKWLALLESNIQAEIERVTQQLAYRVKALEERYAEPLPQITEEVSVLSAEVDEHLKRMGLVW